MFLNLDKTFIVLNMSNDLNHTNGVILNLDHEDTNGIEFTEHDKVFSNDITVSKIKSLPKTVTLAWKSVNVTVPIKKCFRKTGSTVILKNVNGVVEPGQIVALMGASGC